MTKFGRSKATGWRLLAAFALLLAAASPRAEMIEDALEDEDPTLTAQALRANNNNPITARRRALRTNLNNLLQLMPGTLRTLISEMPETERVKLGGQEAIDQLNIEYTLRLGEAHEMKDKVSKRMYGSTLGRLEDRYPVMRDEMFSMIYKVTSYRFFNDPVRFKEYAQKQLDIAVAIQQSARGRVTQEQANRLRGWQAEIGGFPSLERLNQIYDNVAARQVDDAQLVITTGVRARTNESAAILGVRLSEFRPQQRMPTTAVVPSPVVTARPNGQTRPEARADATTTRTPAVPTTADEIQGGEFARFMRANLPTRQSARSVYTRVVSSVERWSDRYDVNPLLIMSVMGQESLFVGWERAVRVVSHAGAGGLMQLMPATARSLGVTDRWDVDQNIMGGVKYIRDQRASFAKNGEFDRLDAIMQWGAEQIVRGGRNANAVWNEVWAMVPMGAKNAIAAYNSGPGRIYQFGSYANLPSWLRETKNYVPGVLRRYLNNSVDYLRMSDAANTTVVARAPNS